MTFCHSKWLCPSGPIVLRNPESRPVALPANLDSRFPFFRTVPSPCPRPLAAAKDSRTRGFGESGCPGRAPAAAGSRRNKVPVFPRMRTNRGTGECTRAGTDVPFRACHDKRSPSSAATEGRRRNGIPDSGIPGGPGRNGARRGWARARGEAGERGARAQPRSMRQTAAAISAIQTGGIARAAATVRQSSGVIAQRLMPMRYMISSSLMSSMDVLRY